MADRKRCPQCEVSVKAENLAEHVDRVHPGARDLLNRDVRREIDLAARRSRPLSRASWRLGTAVLAVVLALAVGAWAIGTQGPVAAGRISFDHATWDFGDIGQAEISHTFRITNVGSGPLRLQGISTSCMCTSAAFVYGSLTSPRFGQHNNPTWELSLPAGAEGSLVVYYDPTVHPERGHFERDVFVLSDDPLQRETTFTIHANEV